MSVYGEFLTHDGPVTHRVHSVGDHRRRQRRYLDSVRSGEYAGIISDVLPFAKRALTHASQLLHSLRQPETASHTYAPREIPGILRPFMQTEPMQPQLSEAAMPDRVHVAE